MGAFRVCLPLAVAVAVFGCKDPNTSFDVDHCRASSATVVSPLPAGAMALRVATINMWGIPFVSQSIEARFAALAERLIADRSVDVVALQEVWHSDARARLLEAVREEFPHQVDFHGEHGRSGLALLARRPFAERPRFHPFRETGKWWKPWNGEWFGGKGVGAVRLALAEDVSVWVAVTHLHSCYAAGAPLACDDGDEFASYRLSQLDELRAFIHHLAGDAPAIVLGHFNFTPTSRKFGSLQMPSAGASPDPGWTHVDEPESPRERIDHVWVRPGRFGSWTTYEPARVVYADPVDVDAALAVPLSDHCAIAATLVWTPDA